MAVFFLCRESPTNTHLCNNAQFVKCSTNVVKVWNFFSNHNLVLRTLSTTCRPFPPEYENQHEISRAIMESPDQKYATENK